MTTLHARTKLQHLDRAEVEHPVLFAEIAGWAR